MALPGSSMRMIDEYDLEDDAAMCEYAISCKDRLFCVVSSDDTASFLYEDWELADDRKLIYVPMFSEEERAAKWASRNPGPEPVVVVPLRKAAEARLARDEAKLTELYKQVAEVP